MSDPRLTAAQVETFLQSERDRELRNAKICDAMDDQREKGATAHRERAAIFEALRADVERLTAENAALKESGNALFVRAGKLEAENAALREERDKAARRWGMLKRAVKNEIEAFQSGDFTPQQRSAYANGVARLQWVLNQMLKSPDVLSEIDISRLHQDIRALPTPPRDPAGKE